MLSIKRNIHRSIASEIDSYAPYFSQTLYSHPLGQRKGMFDYLGSSQKFFFQKITDLLKHPTQKESPTLTVLNGTFNFHWDIQELLSDVHAQMHRSDRLSVIVYNSYFKWLFRLGAKFGLCEAGDPSTFISENDLTNLAKISQFEIVRIQPVFCFFSVFFFGFGRFLDSFLKILPGFKHLSVVWVTLLRPIKAETQLPTLTVVVPARNERGNIVPLIERLPNFHTATELIFVEGHSNDGTWEEIQHVLSKYSGPLKISAYQQTGKGKSDAVRLGFAKASGEVLVILDADLTMPPELLPRYYQAYCRGDGDFVNGSRLMYPMEGEAMQFLNRYGNIFFAKALSRVLDVKLGDSLCGTKLVSRCDYRRMVQWRNDFGDFDPFGDFEIIFPAAVLGLGVVNIPVRYRNRTYGSTNISRFRHGFMLLKMTLIGLFKIKLSLGNSESSQRHFKPEEPRKVEETSLSLGS